MNEEKVKNLIKETKPAWITDDVDVYDVEAITIGGCASGAYMPAVTYYQAIATMAEHGDDIFEYIYDQYGERLEVPNSVETWGQLCVHYLSVAVEIWAQNVMSQAE